MPPTSVCSPAMIPATLPTMTYTSPKRKRGSSESEYFTVPETPPPSSITSIEERVREEDELGRHSPRTAVARRLSELAIRGDHFPTYESSRHLGQESVPTKCWIESYGGLHNMSTSSPAAESDQSRSASDETQVKSQPEDEVASKPTQSRKIASPRKKKAPVTKPKVHNQRASPPLAGDDENPFTWHDSEITGHNPTDPADDGYGINGVGFKPTAAMAWTRSQKRQRQVADWKSREAREARERRRERRDGIESDQIHAIQHGAVQKKVKFAS